MSDRDPIIDDFLVESYENLDRLDQDLVQLEEDPSNLEVLASIFRTIHTIKGTAGFLGFEKLESLSHAGENLLSRLRDGLLQLNAERTSGLLAMVDGIREMLASVERDAEEGDTEYGELAQKLTQLMEDTETPASEEETPDPSTRIGEILIEGGNASRPAVARAADEQRAGDDRPLGQILVEQGETNEKNVDQALETQKTARAKSVADSGIRVKVGLLDQLMNLVGELVLARNQILQHASDMEHAGLTTASQHLNMITSDLQEGVMKTRMQPIGTLWNKLPRVVRDLAVTHEKKIRIEMEGRETELDRTIIESIKGPLTHIVRNSVDHGVEPPDVRRANGKPEEAVLSFRAFHEGGQVNIEISDDGGGIDSEHVRDKAIEKGLLTREQADRMTENELTNMIFVPGFSTADTITNTSGRGVGMDVVKTNIESIGGTVDIYSKSGEGTTLRIKIPLTLAIIPALIVTTGTYRYAIPQASLVELFRIDEAMGVRGIEKIHGAPVYRLRGKLLPLVYLNEVLGLSGPRAAGDPEGDAPETASLTAEAASVNIVVLQADGQQFGLVLDEVNDSQEIVVRPLGSELENLDVYAGATVMGDGRVALILDILGVAQRGHIGRDPQDAFIAAERMQDHSGIRGDVESFLICRSSGDGRMALPLTSVHRLEEFPRSTVEHVGDRIVVQYRGEIMPLIRISEFLHERRAAPRSSEAESEDENFHVVVCLHMGRSIGLVVDEILDIVQQSVEIRDASTREGVSGAIVLEDRVTELLDLEYLIKSSRLPLPEGSEVLVEART